MIQYQAIKSINPPKIKRSLTENKTQLSLKKKDIMKKNLN